MSRFICITLLVILTVAPVIYAEENAKHKEALSKYYRLEKPEGAGPFPAVMMVPGCSGFDKDNQKERFDEVQKRLVELGFVTMRVNSLAARNETDCREAYLQPSYGTDDIYIAVEYLIQQPFVKKESVNIVGWSWGGAAVLLALSAHEYQKPIPFGAVVAYYPACDWAKSWKSEVPVLVLGASLDNICHFNKCEYIFNKLPNRNKLTVRVYEGAHHGFDNPAYPAEMQSGSMTMVYNEAAAKSAWIEVTEFLKR